jgi:hypothetical protein
LPTSGTSVHANWHTSDKPIKTIKAGGRFKVGANQEKKKIAKMGNTTTKRSE